MCGHTLKNYFNGVSSGHGKWFVHHLSKAVKCNPCSVDLKENLVGFEKSSNQKGER